MRLLKKVVTEREAEIFVRAVTECVKCNFVIEIMRHL